METGRGFCFGINLSACLTYRRTLGVGVLFKGSSALIGVFQVRDEVRKLTITAAKQLALSPHSEGTQSSNSGRKNSGFGSSEINTLCGMENSTHPAQFSPAVKTDIFKSVGTFSLIEKSIALTQAEGR